MGFLGIACWAVALMGNVGATVPPSDDAPSGSVDFQADVRPLLATRCFICHGFDEDAREGGLRLDSRVGSRSLLPSGRVAVSPGDPEGSEMLQRVQALDPSMRMPPEGSGDPLDPAEVDLLRRWITGGAQYSGHWAFERVERPTVPASNAGDWGHNEIDAFLLPAMGAAGLAPSPPGDPFVLVRRVFLDLTGLPPTPEEVQAFADAPSLRAYEQLVDRLLDSSAYGERWARVWLDQARYADSMGYTSDPLRTIWRFRDWVIDAYNQNMPFDRFTREQMAGDLLANATLDQRLATAFHRNTMNNTEGGTDDEEFRIAAVKDRMTTSMQVWMGLTASCAECHSHKFDPLSYTEYYRLAAIFNQTTDRDSNNDAPVLGTPSGQMAADMERLRGQLEALDRRLAEQDPDRRAARSAWQAAALEAHDSWVLPPLISASSREGATLEWDEEGILRASGANPPTDLYQVELELQPGTWHGLRLEVLAEEGRGPGRASHGNFVLNELRASAPPRTRPVPGQRVRLELPGAGRILSLAEVQVWSGGENIASGGTARQSSTAHEGAAERAIDGQTSGHYFNEQSVTHTATEADPWWELELEGDSPIDEVKVFLRSDGDLFSRSNGLQLSIRSADGTVTWSQDLGLAADAGGHAMGPRGARALALVEPSATWSQTDFSIAEALDGDAAADSGWAVAPHLSASQEAVFVFADPVVLEEPGTLRLELEQTYGSGHTLSALRFGVAGQGAPLLAMDAALTELFLEEEPDTEGEQRLAALWREHDPVRRQLSAERGTLQAELDGFKPVQTPILVALPAEKQRKTFTLRGGNFLNPVEEVQPGVPEAFHPLPAGFEADRLGFAEWLIHRDNPLTARVAVNRLWAQLFGVGIVESEENFGSQGNMPVHRDLIDWLAAEYMDRGWDQKALLKIIVTSAAYRQASRIRAGDLEVDPRNRLLARGPVFRMEAEMVRDQALMASGLLATKVGGPSVFPPQPPGLWQAAFNGQRTWATSQGEDRYRRGLYTFLRRSMPYPSMQIFDAPSREVCTSRRIRTNTPLQAFVTLNDPAYVEMAQALGRRMHTEGSGDIEAGVRRGLWLVLQRPPAAVDVAELVTLFEDVLETWEGREEEALALATDPLGALPESLGAEVAAAWTTVANVLLNLDAVLVKD